MRTGFLAAAIAVPLTLPALAADAAWTAAPSEAAEPAEATLSGHVRTYTRQEWTLAVGADNVFNAFPDALSPANSSFPVQTFPATSPFGFNGRFIYSRLSVPF